ncbi:hypothetical protein BDR26DRAFT_706857 [Obelidium mucronatum]|nr:hypothetical protein BDR26DRAFT_706857 [Obelidium mucronatum]
MRQSALPIALLIIRLIVVGYCSSTENDTAVGSTVESNEWEADLEADDVVLPQCVFGQDMKAKYGWLDYADFTAGKRAIIVEMDWWDSAILTSQIFTFLLIHIMGYKVNLRSYDGGPVSGSRLNHGNSSDVVLELWRSDASTWYEKYVQLSNTVISYGSVGYTGRVGLYFPTYMFDLYPEYDELDFWKSLVHPESRRAFPYSGTIPTILDEDGLPACDGDPRSCVNGTYVPAWYSESEKENFMEIWHHGTAYTPNYFQRLIDGLHLNATVNFLGESMYPTMMEAYNNRKPFLVYNWRPTTTVAQFNLTRVGFPEDTSGSFARFQKDPQNNPVAVDIPPEILFKASSSRFLEDFPELGYFMTKFQITDKHMQNLLASIGANLPYWIPLVIGSEITKKSGNIGFQPLP